jgi:L-alanine-DL-glutamate epimerase-like enolase superfamily enzyme
MIYGPGGEVTLPETPGLGASVDEKFLQKLKKTVIKA